MGLNWCITGGCGFIGRNLVKDILSRPGHTVKVVDNFSVGTPQDLARVCCLDDVELVQGDIMDAEIMVEVARKIDVMVHLAANTGVAPSVEDPRSDCLTNVMGTLNCLEAARINQVKRFIFASSGAPVGECDPPISEMIPPRPVSPYGASKLAGEGYCSAYFHSYGLETIALRFGNVYGEYSGHKDSVIAKFIRQLINGESLEIYGDGSQTRDFIYIKDLVQAIRKAAVTVGVGGEIFQIATNQETSVREVSELIVERFKKERSNAEIKINYAEKRVGDVQRNFSDTSKAKKMLNWRSETKLGDGIKNTIRWFLDGNK